MADRAAQPPTPSESGVKPGKDDLCDLVSRSIQDARDLAAAATDIPADVSLKCSVSSDESNTRCQMMIAVFGC